MKKEGFMKENKQSELSEFFEIFDTGLFNRCDMTCYNPDDQPPG